MTDAERPGAIGYIRTGSSVAMGVAGQRRELREWSRKAGARIGRWFTDVAEPDAVEERPELLRALSCLGPQSRLLCIARPEVVHETRWVQEVVEHVAVHAGGTVIYAIHGLAADRSTHPNLDPVLDLHERLLLRLQVARAPELKQPREAVWGQCPWGYRVSADGMHLEPNPAEQAVGTIVKHMRLRGLKLRQIRDELIALGVAGRTGKPLGISRIYALLNEGHGSRLDVLALREVADPDAPPASTVRPSVRPGAASRPADERATAVKGRSRSR